MSEFVQFTLSGLTVGCIYALVALGFVITANVTRVYNFAQGEYVMLGGMVTAWAVRAGLPLPIGILIACLAAMLAGVLQERLTVAPIRRGNVLALVVGSMAVSAILRGIALVTWGKDIFRVTPFIEGTWGFAGARFDFQLPWIWGTTIMLLLAMSALFHHSNLGRAMRACAENPEGALLLGIRLGIMSLVAFAISSGLGGLIGAVTVPVTFTSWSIGFNLALPGFVAAALARFRDPVRTVAAGLALGVTRAFIAGYWTSAYVDASIFLILILYLAWPEALRLLSGIWRSRRRASGALRELRSSIVAARRQVVRVAAPFTSSSPLVPSHLGGLGGAAVVFAIAATIPLYAGVRELDAANIILLEAVGAVGLGLVLGLGAQFVLGQGAFFLMGGYVTAILTTKHDWAPVPALMFGALLSAVIALLTGRIALRLSPWHLALTTLAIHLLLLSVVRQNEPLWGGALGPQGVPPFHIGNWTAGQSGRFFLVMLVMLVACIYIAHTFASTRPGRALRAVADNEPAAELLGVNSIRYKVMAFAVGSIMASMAGSMWAHYLRGAGPHVWDFDLTLRLLTYVVIGGADSPIGGAVGAIGLGIARNWVRRTFGTEGGIESVYEPIIFGVLLATFVLFLPGGIVRIAGRLGGWISTWMGAGGRWLPTLRRHHRDSSASPVISRALSITSHRLTGSNESGGQQWQLDAYALTIPTGGSRSSPVAASRNRPILRVIGVCRSFGGVKALDNVSLDIQRGHLTAVIGPNGAGKSTLLNIISGIDRPDAGEVWLGSIRIDGRAPHTIAELGLSRLLQSGNAFDRLSALDNMLVAQEVLYTRWTPLDMVVPTPWYLAEERRLRRRALELLASIGMLDTASLLVGTLGFGRKRMLDIGKSIAMMPQVLVLDEPAAGLSFSERDHLANVLMRLRERGITVVLVEHDMALVMRVADVVVVLDHGSKIAEGRPYEIQRDPRVQSVYLGAPE